MSPLGENAFFKNQSGKVGELGVSRSTIARQMVGLYASGAYERIYVKVSPRVTICYYRLKD